MAFFEKYKFGWLLRIKLAPGSSFNGFRGLYTDEFGAVYLKAAVTSVPEKGKANAALIKLLAQKLAVSKSSIQLLGGETEHLKKLYVTLPLSAETEKKFNSLPEEQNDRSDN